MTIVWDNPLGLHFIATQRCEGCKRDRSTQIWSRPWQMAGGRFADCMPETPLHIFQVAAFLRGAPFHCDACGGTEATISGVAVDEGAIYF